MTKKEKRTFYCSKHQCFHKYMYHGKPSHAYKKCLNSDDFFEFKDLMLKSELFRISFKRQWKQEKANYYKKK